MTALALAIIQVLLLAILAHAILSWLIIAGVRNDVLVRLYQTIGMALDPLYRPLRRVIPPMGMLDITPLVAIIVLIILQRAIVSLS